MNCAGVYFPAAMSADSRCAFSGNAPLSPRAIAGSFLAGAGGVAGGGALQAAADTSDANTKQRPNRGSNGISERIDTSRGGSFRR